jgi:hypothetical protein
VPFGAAVLSDIKARWHFILFGVIFTVTQVGDHIVGRNMVFACFLSCIDTWNETGIQKVFCVTLADVSNAVELVFCHAVRVLFKNFIELQQGRHFYPSFDALFFVSGRSNIFHGWMIGFWNLSRSFSPTGGKSLLILSFGRIFRTFFKWVQIRMKPRFFGL